MKPVSVSLSKLWFFRLNYCYYFKVYGCVCFCQL